MNPKYLTPEQIKQLLADGLKQLQGQLVSTAGIDATMVADFIQRTQTRTALVLSGFATGDITLQELQKRLQDEELLLTGFLYTMKVIAKDNIQGIFNVAKSVLANVIIKIIIPV